MKHRTELLACLQRTWSICQYDLFMAAAESGEPLTGTDVREFVLDENYGRLSHGEPSPEAQAEWKALTDADRAALVKTALPQEKY